MADSEFTKDPQAVLDYAQSWTAWLSEDETITAHTVTVPAGLTKDSSSVEDGVVTVWLSGGEVDRNYDLTFHIVTDQGREDDRTMRILVRNR